MLLFDTGQREILWHTHVVTSHIVQLLQELIAYNISFLNDNVFVFSDVKFMKFKEIDILIYCVHVCVQYYFLK